MTIWWAGPAMVSLAFDEDQRAAPYYLVHLLADEAPDGYFQSLGELLREEQAQLLWRGRLQGLRAGHTSDGSEDVAVIEFAEGAGVVQMLTGTAYRDAKELASPTLLGTDIAPGPIAQDETLVLWLLDTTEDADAGVLEPLSRSAEAHGGQVVWEAPCATLEGEGSWDHLLLLAFPDQQSVQSWLDDAHTATDRALVRRHVTREVLLELRSG